MADATPKRRHESSSTTDGSPVDRISNLPESIISEILSSLYTKQAVATSVLSRSWRYRWTTVTSFNFEKCGESSPNQIRGDAADFVDFVNMVLLKHSGGSINRFLLKWVSPDLRPVCLSTWASIAIARNVRILIMVAKREKMQCESQLPYSLYTSGTLEMLKLIGDFRVKPPNVVSLPRLNVLELFCVIYDSDESVHKLVSGCPVLEFLTIRRQSVRDNMVVCSISSPTVKHIVIDFCDVSGGEQSVGGDLRLKIDAPAVERLYFYDSMSSHISIQPRLSLVDEVAFEAPNLTHGMIVELFQAFGSVEYLTLHSENLKAMESAKLSVSFKNLVGLDIHSERRPRWSCLMDLLDSCNVLKELQICCYEPQSLGDDPWRDPARVPRCLESRMRRLTLTGFEGHEDEMAMLRFFLDRSFGMRRVKICCDEKDPIDYLKRFKILNQVSQLSRASPNCIISWLEDVSSAGICKCFDY